MTSNWVGVKLAGYGCFRKAFCNKGWDRFNPDFNFVEYD